MKPELAAFSDINRHYPVFINIIAGKIRVYMLMILQYASMLVP